MGALFVSLILLFVFWGISKSFCATLLQYSLWPHVGSTRTESGSAGADVIKMKEVAPLLLLRGNFSNASKRGPQLVVTPVPPLGFWHGNATPGDATQCPDCLMPEETCMSHRLGARTPSLMWKIKERWQPELPPPFATGFTHLPIQ